VIDDCANTPELAGPRTPQWGFTPTESASFFVYDDMSGLEARAPARLYLRPRRTAMMKAARAIAVRIRQGEALTGRQ